MTHRLLWAGIALLALAVAAVPARSDPAVGAVEDGYTYRDGFWWQGGMPYTRAKVYEPQTYYLNSYGCYVPSVRYYTWSYTRAAYAAPTLAVPPYTPDWKAAVLKYAAARDDLAAYQAALAALGIKGQSYDFSQGGLYGGNLNLGSYGANGQSIYTYQSYKEAYGSLDLNTLYQQAARLTQGSQQLAGQAHSEFSELVDRAGTNQARVAEILAKAEAARKVLEGVNPQPRTIEKTTIQGSGPAPTDPEAAADLDAKKFLATVGIPKCGACHTGQDAKGKFLITDYPNMGYKEKMDRVWSRLRPDAPDDKRMPRAADGKPGPALTAAEFAEFVRH